MEQDNPLADPHTASAVFFPRPDMPYGPEANGARDHLFDSEPGVRLRLRLFPGPADAPAILFFHGNGETARDYDGLADEYRALPATFAVAEYRGYGPSTGEPSLRTFLGDAHRTLDELKTLLAAEGRPAPVVVMGRSLGSAPAIELASARPSEVAGLVVESGFARIVPLLELIGVPAGRLGITEDHGPQNERKMAKVEAPTLILHAEEDEIIPIRDAELLHAASRDPGVVFFRVPGAGHNDIQHRAGPAYFERIRELLARLPR
ncbi:MAG TPA: alpha/beta fold hydrolase [Polyangia bacterium]|nr:alpha/beta fold hydrolase [Polyangia bacterium]